MYNCAFNLVAGAPKALKRGRLIGAAGDATLPTPCQHAPRKIARDSNNRLVDLQEANRKRESQLLAKKRLLEGLERTRDRKRRTRRADPHRFGRVRRISTCQTRHSGSVWIGRWSAKQDRALFDLPPTLCPGPGSPLRMDPVPTSPTASGELASRAIPAPYPITSKASPSPSGLEAANPRTLPLPRSSSGPRISSWPAPTSSKTETRTPTSCGRGILAGLAEASVLIK